MNFGQGYKVLGKFIHVVDNGKLHLDFDSGNKSSI